MLKNILWTVSSRYGAQALAILSNVWLARVLGADGFGEYALAYTATTPDNLQTVIPACIATGLEPLPALQEVLQVAPNPTADSWTVTFAPIVGIDRLVVTDLSGKTWRDLVVKGQQAIVIPTTDLASGMYVLQAFSGNKLVDSVKVARQ